jgi:rhamnulose-1-phosphate aldolase
MAKNKAYPRQLESLLAEVADVAGRLSERGWVEHRSGNFTLDVSEFFSRSASPAGKSDFRKMDFPVPQLANATFLVTATGARMRDLARKPEAHVLVLRIAEKANGYSVLYAPTDGSAPTTALLTHLMIHQTLRKKKRTSRAVLHAHPNALVAMTHMSEFQDYTRLDAVLFGMHPQSTLSVPAGVGFIPYMHSESKELAKATAAKFEEHTVALWEKHGVFAAGETIMDAFDTIDVLEKSASLYLLVRSTGRTPEGLREDQRAELLDHGRRP